MKISIIIPTYNSSATIKTCIESIRTQSYYDWEIVIIDGMSTDDTIISAKSYEDDRIRIVSEYDSGVYDAMNKGVDIALGDWLFFLGSDDFLCRSTVFEEILPYLCKDLDVVYGDVISDAWSEPLGEWNYDSLWSNRCHQSIFYNKRFFKDANRYNLKYKIWADHDINLRWFLLPQYKSLYVPIFISHFSVGGLSHNNKDDRFIKDFGLLVCRYGRKTLPIKNKKEYLRDYIRNNNNKITNLLVKAYILYLRLVSFIKSRNDKRYNL